jgi:hypothetical protein
MKTPGVLAGRLWYLLRIFMFSLSSSLFPVGSARSCEWIGFEWGDRAEAQESLFNIHAPRAVISCATFRCGFIDIAAKKL